MHDNTGREETVLFVRPGHNRARSLSGGDCIGNTPLAPHWPNANTHRGQTTAGPVMDGALFLRARGSRSHWRCQKVTGRVAAVTHALLKPTTNCQHW